MLEFNKKTFAELLKKALGPRSINKYGKDCKVDPGYISRLIRELIKNPPSVDIIKKLSSKTYNNVTYDDFMSAAGYMNNPNLNELSKLSEEQIPYEIGKITYYKKGNKIDLSEHPPEDLLEILLAVAEQLRTQLKK